MKATDRTTRLLGTGSDKWAVCVRARQLAAAGNDVIDLTIGEPDVDAPSVLVDDERFSEACDRMCAQAKAIKGRTSESDLQSRP